MVSRLRDAGAVVLGKTNLSEWANFRSERSSSGWSAIGGQTGNAHDVTRSPCGSSAGSAVAVALGFAVAAVGTETNGSVICPAAMNGIVGIKPTVGLLPRSHIVPISHTQDTAGPMARSVVDAAILLAAMQGEEGNDEATRGVPSVPPDHYLPHAPSLDGVRLGVVRGSVRHRRVQSLLDERLVRLEASGVTLVDDVAFQPYDGFDHDTYNILLFEFRQTIRDYLASLGGQYADWALDDLIAFNVENRHREMPWFGQEIFEKSRDLEISDTEYEAARARTRKAARDDGIDRIMAEHELDAIVAPSNGPAWKIDLVHGDRGVGGFTTYPAVAGYPHVTVPMGTVHGLPIGLSLTGGARCGAAIARTRPCFRDTDSRALVRRLARSASDRSGCGAGWYPS
ncbi:MAG: amidase family protein [Gammaproteobacteria bacterium]|nr:amidase family protein [Gammaproteobacteria bacterium]